MNIPNLINASNYSNLGSQVGNSIVSGMQSSLSKINLSGELFKNISNHQKDILGLPNLGLDARALKSLYANLGTIRQSGIDVTKVFRELDSAGNVTLKFNGLDSLGNAVTVVSRLNQSTKEWSNTFSQTMDTGLTQAIRNAEQEAKQIESIFKSIDLGDLDAKLAKLQSGLGKYDVNAKGFSQVSNEILTVENEITTLKQLEEDYKNGNTNLGGQIVAQYGVISDAVKKATNDLNSFKVTQTSLLTESQKATAENKFSKWCEQNSKAVRVYKKEIEELSKQLQNLNTKSDLDKFNAGLQKLDMTARENGNLGKTFLQGLTGVTKQTAQFAMSYLSIYRVFSTIKQGVSTVKELDTALVDLRKTTTMSAGELKKFYFDANEVAKEYGSTTKEIIQSAAEWSRLGYSDKNSATQMAQFSSQFATISPGMNIESATESLTSIMKAYDVEVKDVKTIMSKINEIGNTQATSNEDIAIGLKQAASSFALTGTSFDQLVGLFTSAQEVVQDSSRVGNALKTIAMRIRGYDEEGNVLDENVTGDLYDLTGISIWKDATKTQYKELGDYMKEVADNWANLSAETQQKALEKMFGKTRANVSPNVQKCA